MSSEVFYLHLNGEQRGPYTVAQIDHLLNSGLIPLETLYWREGMEQDRPVTDLVRLRREPTGRRWIKRAVLIVLFLVVALVARLFGPITLVGWRETAQYDFTPRAAYWRARDTVRHQAVPAGSVLAFGNFESSRVELLENFDGASVWLHAQILAKNAQGARSVAWHVRLAYDTTLRIWSAVSIQTETP